MGPNADTVNSLRFFDVFGVLDFRNCMFDISFTINFVFIRVSWLSHLHQVYNRLEAMKVAKVLPPGKLPKHLKSHVISYWRYWLVFDKGMRFKLPHFVGGEGNETRCTVYGDFEGFARQKCAWKFGLVSYDDFLFEFCFSIECLQLFMGCSYAVFFGGEGRRRERVKRF